jgi:hypothetical protein
MGLLIVLPFVVFIAHAAWLVGEQQRLQAALDSTALQAAEILSRVTVNDPTFGFVGISNVSPIGIATRSASGSPLPVIGYNTLVGTVRLDNLLARQIDNDTFRKLAARDADSLEKTTQTLNSALSECASARQRQVVTDWDGNKISAFKSARSCFLQMLGGGESIDLTKLKTFDLALGRTQNAYGTGIRNPEGAVSNQNALPYYAPFRDYPVASKHFIFAALGANASLCSPADFLPPAPSQLSSVVCVTASVELKDPILEATPWSSWLGTTSCFNITSCAQPGSCSDVSPPGVLTVQFANGQIPCIQNLSDILSSSSDLNEQSAELYTAVNGNFPDDPNAQLLPVQSEDDTPASARVVLATALYDWLRNQHCRPGLSTLDKVLSYNFTNQQGKLVCIFEISPNGEMLVRSSSQNPFSANLVAEGQLAAQCSCSGQVPFHLMIRDEVHLLGTVHGGKEGGQPSTGDPVNWCELTDFGESTDSAEKAGKGSRFLNVTLAGQPSSKCTANGAISPSGVSYQTANKIMRTQPHTNFYSGGLALDILFGLPG